ncbi:flagellar protein FliT [Pigmentiphaga aceris]|uniref:Flagellar protein FliT n=1 Tax=Pigmentiphaga aceris TaxID=1940612 RepID=A0A5C0B3B2_9BURK|nr:flagellar protein FliT [Pigmentiphaga aceris]QEI07251.1 flagellar protein FliT [Pigmentiphaga aceris]
MHSYQQLSDLSVVMLEAARRGDWDTVTSTERICARVIGDLRQYPDPAPVNDVEHEERMRLLRTILANDAEVRDLAQPWMRELERILQSSKRRPAIPSFR